jgi:formylmethanofuran dehydrogenase subunit B
MQFEHVTCPHCGILCDDLTIEVNDSSLKPLNVDHPQCTRGFTQASFDSANPPSAKIAGKNVSLDVAINKAVDILQSSSQPLVSGLIADVQACREAVALTEKIGGVIDHANGEFIRANIAVLQRMGKVKTTLAEARNRADHIIIFGSEVLESFPRLLDRVLSPKKSLGTKNTTNKAITIIDSQAQQDASKSFDQANINYLHLDAPSLESIIQSLQSIIQSPNKELEDESEVSKILKGIYLKILDSQYTTIIWNTGLLDTETAEQTVQAITLSIKTLMKEIRCVGLPLGGSKGEITASQVATWQTGVPLPVAFMSGTPVHDPVLYDGSTMLENNEADSLVWLSTYSPDDVAPETNIPTIVIGHPNMQVSQQTAVFIPVGVPGIDSRGLACRTDSVATLPLQKIRSNDLPVASDVLNKISGML